MEGLDSMMDMLNYILADANKRHIVGGMLLSISALFGGLAVTVMTLKGEKHE